MDETVLYFGLAAAPIIAALLQAIKPFVTGPKWWPLIAIVLGVAWNLGVSLVDSGGAAEGLLAAGITGVVVGLAASGLYSAQKTVRPPN